MRHKTAQLQVNKKDTDYSLKIPDNYVPYAKNKPRKTGFMCMTSSNVKFMDQVEPSSRGPGRETVMDM